MDLINKLYAWMQAVITRVNSITGKMYKNDATIFAWELMNEPRCTTSPSGTHLQVCTYLLTIAIIQS